MPSFAAGRSVDEVSSRIDACRRQRPMRRAGLPEPRLHHVVRIEGEDAIELDLDWDGVLVDVELDGRDHTARMLTGRRDRRRDRFLQAAGYEVLRYPWDDYVADRDAMVAEISWFLDAGRDLGALGHAVRN